MREDIVVDKLRCSLTACMPAKPRHTIDPAALQLPALPISHLAQHFCLHFDGPYIN